MTRESEIAARLKPSNNGHTSTAPRVPPNDEIAFLNTTYGDLRRAGYRAIDDDTPIDDPERLSPIRIYTAEELLDEFHELHPPVIDGLLRECETMNLISVSKAGKSWMALGLILSIVTGVPWLGRFVCRKGRVLVVDNELHEATLSGRLRSVLDAMGIRRDELNGMLHFLPARGAGLDIFSIGKRIEGLDDRYLCILIDAKYRAIPGGTSENDNASETALYNEVDRLAKSFGSSFVFVHHSSKGLQGERRVTDVGAGAGAQSRAADSHVVIREHEDGVSAVLEAAVRSFAPVEPMGLRFEFPLWVPDDSINVQAVKGRQSRGHEQQTARNREADDAILDTCKDTALSRVEIRTATGMGRDRINAAIRRLVDSKQLQRSKEDRPKNKDCDVFRTKIQL